MALIAKAKGHTGTLVFLAFLLFIGGHVAYNQWNESVFNKMTPAQHLDKAEREPLDDRESVQSAERHVAALPANSPQSEAAEGLRKRLDERNDSFKKIDGERAARLLAIKQLDTDLRGLGYDLTVSSAATGEVDVTSSEFADTDHRVRFLTFIRGRNSPTMSACWAGYTTIRLKSTQIPWVGFDESYSLDCIK